MMVVVDLESSIHINDTYTYIECVPLVEIKMNKSGKISHLPQRDWEQEQHSLCESYRCYEP